MYELNLWAIKARAIKPKYKTRHQIDSTPEFKYRLVINNKLVSILVDTGKKISVCDEKQAAAWGILDRMVPSKTKIHPYCSEPIPVKGIAMSHSNSMIVQSQFIFIFTISYHFK